MALIKNIHAREILDSRGNPTLEVEVHLDSKDYGRFCVPSGASTGEYEAIELRDTDSKRFLGKGVQSAVRNVREVIAPRLLGVDANDQGLIDAMLIQMDATPNKAKLGANAILGVSMACARASAAERDESLFAYLGGDSAVTLPVPMMNVVNGGAHADNNLDIQEFMIVPYGFTRFSESLRCGAEIFQTLKSVLKKQGFSTSVGDEGGFAPHTGTNEETLALICEAIEKAGYKPGVEVGLALDVAASEFFDRETEKYILQNYGSMSSNDLIQYYKELTEQFPIVSIEDGLDQNDWPGFKTFTQKLGRSIQIVGDDLFVTSESKLRNAINESVANAVLVKPNQVGTLTETLATVRLAQKAGYGVILSHRSGETEDTSIADLAVATNAGQIKTGSLSRTDRVAKYNQLLRIEEELGDRARFLGQAVLQRNVGEK